MSAKLFDGKSYRLCLDQYGDPVWARTVKELKEKSGHGKVSKQYVDKKTGGTVHNGYVVGRRWFSIYLSTGDKEELAILKQLAAEGEGSPDWSYGETLIRDSYFTKYIEELIDDCYSLPKEFNSGEWPWRHMTLDYEAAADEAKADYFGIDFDGVTYWIRG